MLVTRFFGLEHDETHLDQIDLPVRQVALPIPSRSLPEVLEGGRVRTALLRAPRCGRRAWRALELPHKLGKAFLERRRGEWVRVLRLELCGRRDRVRQMQVVSAPQLGQAGVEDALVGH